jgi:sec-independent protein translocase protein TatC
MFLLAIPIALAFLSGLALLWLYTLGGRRQPGRTEPAD